MQLLKEFKIVLDQNECNKLKKELHKHHFHSKHLNKLIAPPHSLTAFLTKFLSTLGPTIHPFLSATIHKLKRTFRL